MSIGENIKKIRKEKGLKQKDMASDMEVVQSYISQVENNKTTPTPKFIKLFCLQYGVEKSDIYENMPSKEDGGSNGE
jgi:transcriptional regulator with XRE-family HTH domain